MKNFILWTSTLFLFACASTPLPQAPSIQYYLSSSQPACEGLKDCQSRCDQEQQGRACLEWALYALSATTNSGDVDQALSQESTNQPFVYAAGLLKTACHNQDALSCLDLGNLHLQGLGVPLDQASALKYLDIACTDGVADSCTRLGMLYQEGVAVAPDAERATKLFKTGCTAGHEAACSLLKELN
ncbi:MAG: sel1 repeat family protein [Deltaproteobacteria bacterium]|jgi:TPR repeat protein|nr:sel1 repeat family protein [Deltaproteobacteria bacterium]